MNIVITGGTRGIGNGLVKHFLRNRHNVVFSGTSEKSVLMANKGLSGKNIGVVCDITKPIDIEKLYNEAYSAFGPIDIWFNNAGVNQERALVRDLKYSDIDKVIDINVKGMMYATSFVVGKMLEEGKGIVYNMEGLGSDDRMIPETSLYGSSKRLLRYFSIAASKELKNEPVRVGRVSPGMVFTDLLMAEQREDASKIINILADDVETVAAYIGKKIESGKQNIFWLTTLKVLKKFMLAPFKKHN